MISGATRLAGVIGEPVRHSRSPAIHNAAYAATGLDWVYVAFPVAKGDVVTVLGALARMDIAGVSVTMPHKVTAATECDRLLPGAARLGVVNSIKAEAGCLVGDNSDGDGLVDALTGHDASPEGAHVVVVGAGATATALVEALGRRGAGRITVAARRERAARTAAEPAGDVGRAVSLSGLGADVWHSADIVVNATPAGMIGGGAEAARPVPVDRLASGAVVVDVVYNPVVTPLLAEARRRGHPVVDGLDLLVGLSARVFSWWTGLEAPLGAMRRAADGAHPE